MRTWLIILVAAFLMSCEPGQNGTVGSGNSNQEDLVWDDGYWDDADWQ